MEMHDPGEIHVTAWTRTVPKGGAKSVMDGALAQATGSGSEILVMDGQMVFGTAHVRSAVMHAAKATSDGRNSSDSLAMETLLYASGERQLSSAIKKMAVGPETETVVVAVIRGQFSPGEGWSPLPDTGPVVDRRRLARFGVTEKEMSTVSEEQLAELILEKVAAVDLIKR